MSAFEYVCVVCIYVGGHAHECEEARAECQVPLSKTLSLILRQGLSVKWTLTIPAKLSVYRIFEICLSLCCLCLPLHAQCWYHRCTQQCLLSLCVLGDGAQTFILTESCLPSSHCQSFPHVVRILCCRHSSEQTGVRGVLHIKTNI